MLGMFDVRLAFTSVAPLHSKSRHSVQRKWYILGECHNLIKYTECCYAECPCAKHRCSECHHSQRHCSECHHSQRHSAVSHYAECPLVKCRFANIFLNAGAPTDCHYDVCCHAECHCSKRFGAKSPY